MAIENRKSVDDITQEDLDLIRLEMSQSGICTLTQTNKMFDLLQNYIDVKNQTKKLIHVSAEVAREHVYNLGRTRGQSGSLNPETGEFAPVDKIN